MLNEQSRRDLADRGLCALGQALDGKQQLMLLRLDAMLFRGCFAEIQEASNLPAKFGEISVSLGG